jgi:hypothetical protein
MGVLKRNLWPAYLGIALAAFVLTGARAGAIVGDISGTATDRAGTIIIFPKVIADGQRDTIIQITNTMNTPRRAHCAYVPGQGFCSTNIDVVCTPPPARISGCPDPGELCLPVPWTEVDFDVALTAQQPTMWRASTGRLADPTDPLTGNCNEVLVPSPVGDVLRQTCPGLDPLDIPPAPGQPFRGQLICYETDESGFPMAGNALKGEAILESLGVEPPQVSQYNSINIEGDSDAMNENVMDLALKLNSNEFNVCPDVIEFNNYAHLGSDPISLDAPNGLCNDGGICTGGNNPGTPCTLSSNGAECDGGSCVGPCPVRTEITFVPCTQNFELGVPIPTTVQVRAIDELEASNSTAFELNCWANLSLEDIGPGIFSPNRSDFFKTRIFVSEGRDRCVAGDIFSNPNADPRYLCDTDADCGAGGVCGPAPGVLAVVEEFHEHDASLLNGGVPGTAAANVHMIGQRRGICRVSGNLCSDNGDCGGNGLCRDSGAACTNDGNCNNSELDRCDICLIDEVVFPVGTGTTP